MSLITWPAGLSANSFALQLLSVQRAHSSPFGGSEQVVDLLNDRWAVNLSLRPALQANGGAADGFIASLRGMTNTVNLWHMARPAPLGTMRGAPTLIGEHAQGSATLSIQTIAGATLKAGDMLGLPGLLLMVAADCTANGSGVISVPIANRLRALVSNGTLVTWDKPMVPFRRTSRGGVGYVPGVANSISLDFLEAIS